MLRKLNPKVIFVILTVVLLTILYRRTPNQTSIPLAQHVQTGFSSVSGSRSAKESLFLTEDQCTEAFPAFDKEIKRALAQGPFKLTRLRDNTPGLVQGRIKSGKLHIISAPKENTLHRTSAILHSLHRAILTSPTPLPDTIFAFTVGDIPQSNAWSFTRSDDDLTPDTPWLMPHYSSWSWPMETLGSLDEAFTRIAKVEETTKWGNKVDKAIWRGKPWFGPDWRAGLRLMLVEVAKGQEWADVEGSNEGQNNTLSIEDFCKYKYVIYAEGKSYSGRLPYHQACASIILTPPPTFLLHNTHLLRPVFSSLLPLNEPANSPNHPKKPTTPPASSYPLPATATSWPLSYPPEEANILFIDPDWADIDLVIQYLREYPEIAEGIARRNRELWVGNQYLSEGAEACYWRALVKAWSEMVRVADGSEWDEGMRWETFSLLGEMRYSAIIA